MSDKIKLLEIANRKAANDSEFVAYVFRKYSEIEKLSEQEIISALNCSLEDYYKLGLCRLPETNSPDYLGRLNKISSYSHITVFELNKIIKRVISVLNLSDTIQNQRTFLMAARDKNESDEKK